jgi:hypothetical protein
VTGVFLVLPVFLMTDATLKMSQPEVLAIPIGPAPAVPVALLVIAIGLSLGDDGLRHQPRGISVRASLYAPAGSRKAQRLGWRGVRRAAGGLLAARPSLVELRVFEQRRASFRRSVLFVAEQPCR